MNATKLQLIELDPQRFAFAKAKWYKTEEAEQGGIGGRADLRHCPKHQAHRLNLGGFRNSSSSYDLEARASKSTMAKSSKHKLDRETVGADTERKKKHKKENKDDKPSNPEHENEHVSKSDSQSKSKSKSKSKRESKHQTPSPAPATSPSPPPEDSPKDPTTSNLNTPTDPDSEVLDFESHYLTLSTAEFAADLDKLRRAPDFRDSSVEMLVAALKQGAKNFNEDEKKIIMDGLKLRRDRERQKSNMEAEGEGDGDV